MSCKKSARTVNGYKLVYEPEHPSCMGSNNWKGYIYEHILVAEKTLGRRMRSTEVVHHLDGNRSNNRSENLIVLERSQHSKIEAWLDRGAPSVKTDGENRMNSGKSKAVPICKICSKTLQRCQKNTCSPDCNYFYNRKVQRPSKEELKKLEAEVFPAITEEVLKLVNKH